MSLRAPGSTIDREDHRARIRGEHFLGSGTPMAAALTAGAVAVLPGARPPPIDVTIEPDTAAEDLPTWPTWQGTHWAGTHWAGTHWASNTRR